MEENRGGAAWVTEGGTTNLPSRNTFSFGVVSSAPPNSQAAIAQAPACLDNAGTPIGNTACVLFNSRGIPVDSTGAPSGSSFAAMVYAPNAAASFSGGSNFYGSVVAATVTDTGGAKIHYDTHLSR